MEIRRISEQNGGLMKRTFKGGIHPSSSKQLTASLPIVEMDAPKTVYIPLAQHLGKPAKAVVEVGATVKRGELIGVADGMISANVYSSVSGVVKAIESRLTPTGKCEHIVIENDGLNEEVTLPMIETLTSDAVRERVTLAGVVGMGGAGFPTGVKLSPANPVDTLIINGAECEPYITCDARIMMDLTEDFLDGVRYLYIALSLQNAKIGIEDNKTEVIDRLNAVLKEQNATDIEVVPLKTKYPQGAEKQMIYAVTGRKVPTGGLPASVGVVVCNVHTALSTYYAVAKGVPVYKRVMTVTGGGITEPKNVWVYNGTTYQDVIDYCGGMKEDVPTVKMISGGPMMGFAVSGAQFACTKTSGCLLLMSNDEAFRGSPSPCINCGKCAKACPMFLMPMYMDLYSRAGDLDTAVKYGLNSCIECGSCTYVCPAKRTLVQSFRLAKKKLRGRVKK